MKREKNRNLFNSFGIYTILEAAAAKKCLPTNKKVNGFTINKN